MPAFSSLFLSPPSLRPLLCRVLQPEAMISDVKIWPHLFQPHLSLTQFACPDPKSQ